jgi:PAS domain S-box-containing protein
MSAITELRRLPQDSKVELHSFFENAPMGLLQCHRHGAITALNPAMEQMLGASASRSLSLADLIHSQDRAQTERLLRELLDGERQCFQIDTIPTTTDGRPVHWTAWRVSGANGEPDCVIASAQDAPENREAEQRLRQAERLEAVGRLAGGVAHDFNNLLTGVLLYCDLLMAHLEPCHRVRKYAEEIRNAGLQATGLVRQLLALARPASSEPRLLSLNEIVEGMRNLLVRLIGENIELELCLDPNLGLVKMDPTQAQQILLNLVLNSRDAMPSGGKITVETSNCKVQALAESASDARPMAALPCALFVVSDNGCGMDAATRAHLFEAFFTTKPGGKGTGLGLATVYDIVTRNGGLINVESAPVRGTRVTVLLPLVPEAALNSQDENVLHTSNSAFIREKE